MEKSRLIFLIIILLILITFVNYLFYINGFENHFITGNANLIEFILNPIAITGELRIEILVPPGVIPPAPPGPGPGPGGGCVENWTCSEWSFCRKLPAVPQLMGSPFRDYWEDIKARCEVNGWSWFNCGYQIRECEDINYCSTDNNKPGEAEECYFTLFPSCHDGIRNRHHEEWEEGIDCGGACAPCPTCSDGIQNQGETGVDSGGPCLECELPLPAPNYTQRIILLLFLILLLVIVILLFIKFYKRVKYEFNQNRLKRMD
jgi:hypothetical protein